ncbi:hypothetical protein ES703_84593 [subsurface metagenome]
MYGVKRFVIPVFLVIILAGCASTKPFLGFLATATYIDNSISEATEATRQDLETNKQELETTKDDLIIIRASAGC